MSSATLLTVLLALAGPPATPFSPQGSTRDHTISQCAIMVIKDVQVPAREPGLLTGMTVKQWELVAKDTVMATVDDTDAQVRRKAAEFELNLSRIQAESEANIHAAEATEGVALSEWEMAVAINERSPTAYSLMEINRLELTYKRTGFQAEIAREEKQAAVITEQIRAAQVEAVQNEITRRQVVSPLDGVIVQRYKHEGEWVSAGDPIFRVIQMNRLRVEGLLDASRFLPEQVDGRTVIVEVATGQDQVEYIEATLNIVSPVVDESGQFLVGAEFDNPRKANGQWLVRPGLTANVTIKF